MEGLSDFSKFSELLCTELSKIEHEYSEVLYRMRYIDEQLISIGKQDSLKSVMHDLYKSITFTKQEKVFISIAYQENLEILLHILALCKNPIDIVYKLLTSVTCIFSIDKIGTYIKTDGKRIYLSNIYLPYLKNHLREDSNHNQAVLQIEDYTMPVYQYDSRTGTYNCYYVNMSHMNPKLYDGYVIENQSCPTEKMLKFFMEECKESYYGTDILAIDLYEKVLNKRIELENLKAQYDLKMKLFYS